MFIQVLVRVIVETHYTLLRLCPEGTVVLKSNLSQSYRREDRQPSFQYVCLRVCLQGLSPWLTYSNLFIGMWAPLCYSVQT